MQSKVQHIAQFRSHDHSIVLTSFQSPVSDRPAELTKFKITVAVFPGISGMSQHGYMRHMAPPPFVLDLIRLVQSKSCVRSLTFTAESTKFKITVVVFPGISNMSQHGYRPISHVAPLPSHQNLNFKSAIPPRMSHYLRPKKYQTAL